MKHGSPIVKIRLQYCGGCNPEIDRGLLVKRLEDVMHSEGIHIQYVSDPETPDIMLLINGCAHACKEEELKKILEPFPSISVQGKRLQHKPVPEDKLPNVLFKQIRSTFQFR